MNRPTTHVGLLAALLLTACSGAPSAPTGPTTGGGTDQALRAKLVACPTVSNSSDPTASTCLAGTYTGRTPAGAACTLSVRTDGSYDYVSPTLTSTYTPTPATIRLFSHQASGGDNVVLWNLSDPASADPASSLDLSVAFGPNYDTLARKLELKAERVQGGGRTSSTCIVDI
ncbi:hypothetical protein [Deinococcus pimensis]|uniref:hypothetical protein n=1 Tax=Deinococcus pimensis TaxID=309888 RepID=UPI0004892C4B|nr:hypothetical protein [Deinococcus pimensis]